MTTNLEREVSELRSDVRHIQFALDRMIIKQDEFFDRFVDHRSEDIKQFAEIKEKFEVIAAEQRGEGRAAAIVRYAATAIIAALAGLGGGNVKLPGLH